MDNFDFSQLTAAQAMLIVKALEDLAKEVRTKDTYVHNYIITHGKNATDFGVLNTKIKSKGKTAMQVIADNNAKIAKLQADNEKLAKLPSNELVGYDDTKSVTFEAYQLADDYAKHLMTPLIKALNNNNLTKTCNKI